jgi:hypothetical protein
MDKRVFTSDRPDDELGLDPLRTALIPLVRLLARQAAFEHMACGARGSVPRAPHRVPTQIGSAEQ